MKRLALCIALLVAAAVALVPSSDGSRLPGARALPGVPEEQPLEPARRRLPVHPHSDAMVRSIGADETMHADFGSGLYNGGPIGIPYVTVAKGQPRVPVSFDYADESDRGPLSDSRRSVPIEGGRGSDGDRHVIVVDRARCRLYELFAAYPEQGGAAGAPAPARSGTCARTGCARAAGPRRTPPGCRSCPGSPATTRSGAAASTTRCASPRRAPGGRSSTRPATSRPT